MAKTYLRLETKLVNSARVMAFMNDRSVAEQLEFWSNLGRVAESTFSGKHVYKLAEMSRAADISALLALQPQSWPETDRETTLQSPQRKRGQKRRSATE